MWQVAGLQVTEGSVRLDGDPTFSVTLIHSSTVLRRLGFLSFSLFSLCISVSVGCISLSLIHLSVHLFFQMHS